MQCKSGDKFMCIEEFSIDRTSVLSKKSQFNFGWFVAVQNWLKVS